MVSHTICLNCCNLEMVWEERIYHCSYRLVPRGGHHRIHRIPFRVCHRADGGGATTGLPRL